MQEIKVKPWYKMTELGVIPEDWSVLSIKDVCEIKTWSRNTQDKIDDWKYPFFVRSQTIERINSYSFDWEAVLTAWDWVWTWKIFHYLNWKFDYHQRVYKMSHFKWIDWYYFYLYFSNNFYNRVMQMTAKSSVDSVRLEMISDMKIPVPKDINEQKNIAQVLSNIDKLIKSLDELINKKEKIKEWAMQELLTWRRRLPWFSWEWIKKKLEKTFTNITTWKLDANAMVKNWKFRFYTCAKEHYYIDNYIYDEEVLLISGNWENVWYVHYFNWKFNAYQRTYILLWFKDYIFFIKYYLDKYLKDRIFVEAKLWSTPYITKDTLTDMIVNVPTDIEEQKAIAEVLSDMDNEIEALKTKRDKYKQIKDWMMQELLTWKIRLV